VHRSYLIKFGVADDGLWEVNKLLLGAPLRCRGIVRPEIWAMDLS
jgi:hypothetical protein